MLDTTPRLPSNTGSETKPSHYHPALVALHWVSAVLVLVALATGTFWLTATPNSSPDKIAQLSVHMTLGVAILVLTLARLAVRSKTPQPERASSGNVLLDKLRLPPITGFTSQLFSWLSLASRRQQRPTFLPPCLRVQARLYLSHFPHFPRGLRMASWRKP